MRLAGRSRRGCGQHNGLNHGDRVLEFLVALRCLVGVDDAAGQPLGTASIRIERGGGSRARGVEEVLGADNAPLAPPGREAVERFVAVLAADAAAFERFARVGEALGRLGESEAAG